MRRVLPPRIASPALALALLAGCVGQPAAPTAPRKSTKPGPLAIVAPSTAPGPLASVGVAAAGGIIANNGGGVISNNGAALTGKVKMPAGIVANHGGGLISDNGGAIVANNGGGLIRLRRFPSVIGRTRYALAAAPEQKPLAGFEVRLVDAKGDPVLGADGKPLVTTTNGQGDYAFAGVKPSRNLVVEVVLPGDLGAVKAIVPREGGEKRTVDVDLVSTLTTGYIVSRYVRTQADPLATLEKLPADVEAATRQKAAAAVAASGTSPDTLRDTDVVAAVDALRKGDAALDGQMETVKKLLVVAGASNLGSGMPALSVTLGDIHDIAVTSDGQLYIFCQNDKRVWRLREDGTIETAVGARGVPDGKDLDGQKGPEANLDFPKSIGTDNQGRLLVSEARGVYRLEADGTLRSLGAGKGWVMAAGAGDEAIVAVLEDDAWTKTYVFYRTRPGAAPERLFEQRVDPEDYGEEVFFLTGIAWDGGNYVYTGFRNGIAGRWELQRHDLVTRAVDTPWTNAGGDVFFEANGDAIYVDKDGVVKARNVITGAAERTLPPKVPGFPVTYALGPDGTAYAAKFGVVYRLEAGGPVRIAGNPTGQPSGGDATKFTFEVLSDIAVLPSGEFYTIDTGRGLVYRVDAQAKLAEFGKIGGGNVQLLRTDPAGTLWMSDGDGAKIGKFDAAGVWSAAYDVGGLINDFAVGADGTAYAVSWDIGGGRKRVVYKLSGGAKTKIFESDKGLTVALDAAGTPFVAGEGSLRKWDGAAWKVLKADARFDFGLAITGLGMAADKAGRLYLANSGTSDGSPPIVFRYDPAGDAFKVIAGAGGTHFTGAAGADNGLKSPRTPGFDAQGNLYFSDTGNRQVKRISNSEL